MSELEKLRDQLRDFATEREWGQFHSPKNLAIALSVETSELLEHFQWLSDEQSRALELEAKRDVAEETADILLYLVQFADSLGIDLAREATAKLQKNAIRYPVEKVRGRLLKGDEL